MSQRLHVHALPKFVQPEEFSDGAVVVIDVLRASSTIIHAIDAGATAVVPCRSIEEARAIAKQYPVDSRILGGERGGLLIDGFDLGNSPEDYTPNIVGGKTVIFTTTNGTQALMHAQRAKQIFLGAFVNVSAVAEKLLGQDAVHLLCAGTDGQMTDEDILFAGMLAEKLQRQGGAECKLNAQAIAARELWLHTLSITHASVEKPPQPEPLALELQKGLGGKNLVELGLHRDILAAAQIDRFKIVPQFDPKTSRIRV